MATDIVLRLRAAGLPLCDEAAQVIERMRRVAIDHRRTIAGERRKRKAAETAPPPSGAS